VYFFLNLVKFFCCSRSSW